jgi:hypothetical protein
MEHNHIEQELKFDIYSIGRIVSDYSLDKEFKNFYKEGDNLRTVINLLIWEINKIDQNVRLQLTGGSDDKINPPDFSFYKSISHTEITKRLDDKNWIYPRIDYSKDKVILHDILNSYSTTTVNYWIQGDNIKDLHYSTREYSSISHELDEGFKQYLEQIVFNDKSVTYNSVYKYSDNLYWVVANDRVFKLFTTDEDRFIYSYPKGTQVGKIWLDIAKLINSYTWIDLDNAFNFYGRTLYNEELKGKEALTLIQSVVDRSDAKFEVPSNFILSDNVKKLLENYYEKYLVGLFILSTVELNYDQFNSNEYPLIGKNLNIIINGKNEDVGVIKEAIYTDTVIKVKCEKHIS